MTRPLLLAGALAGPLYFGIGTVEAIVRDGFDIRKHSLSLLANGTNGWIHSAMLVGTGLLTVIGVIGLSRSFPPGQRSRWAVGGLIVYGAGVAAAGFLRADPALGFPPGTPDAMPDSVSWHGLGHVIAGFIGFIGLIVACFVLSRWFGRRRANGWSRFSLVTGIVYLLGLVGLGAGSGTAAVNLGFTVAVILGWTWITMLMLRARAEGSLR